MSSFLRRLRLRFWHRYVFAFRMRRRCSRNSSGAAIAGGDFEVLWAPNGEQSKQNRRRYSDRITPSMTCFARNALPQDSHSFVFAGRSTLLRGLSRRRIGRHSRQRFRPRRSIRRPLTIGYISNSVRQSTQVCVIRTCILSDAASLCKMKTTACRQPSSAPVGGVEPPTKGLTVPCSTVELHRIGISHSSEDESPCRASTTRAREALMHLALSAT